MSYQGDETTGFQSPAQDYVEAVIDLPAILDLRQPGIYPVRKPVAVLHDPPRRCLGSQDMKADAPDIPDRGVHRRVGRVRRDVVTISISVWRARTEERPDTTRLKDIIGVDTR